MADDFDPESEFNSIESELTTKPFVIRHYRRGTPVYNYFADEISSEENASHLSATFCGNDIRGGTIAVHMQDQPPLLTLLFDKESIVQEDDFTFAAFALLKRPPRDIRPDPPLQTSIYIDILCTSAKSREQKKGYGRAMLSEIESTARARKYTHVELESIDTAVDFYKKAGYEVVPNEYTNDTWMRKSVVLSGSGRLRLKTLRKSHKKEKKWDAVFQTEDGKTKVVPFGQKGYSDFTKHKDTIRRQRYIDRHSGMGEDWKDPTTPGALSRYILWNKKTLRASLKDFKKKFHV